STSRTTCCLNSRVNFRRFNPTILTPLTTTACLTSGLIQGVHSRETVQLCLLPACVGNKRKNSSELPRVNGFFFPTLGTLRDCRSEKCNGEESRRDAGEGCFASAKSILSMSKGCVSE